ncbi:MAG: hypothetical protein U0R44_07055 [Candidatus Micrarchaeia archaeon]
MRGQVATNRTSSYSRHLRGQVATEFMIYTGVFMFVAVAAFIVISDLQKTEVPTEQNKLAQETGDGFVKIVTLSVKGGTGFAYNYTFPKTLYGRRYTVDLRNLGRPQPTILLEWQGDYGNFSYQYDVPKYSYKVEGTCLNGNNDTLRSNACSNMLMLNNDGENLSITQSP